jgi:spore maturation protein CgeB
LQISQAVNGLNWCHVFPSSGDGEVFALGVSSLDSFQKKDLYFSIKNELVRRGYTVLAVGQRELLGKFSKDKGDMVAETIASGPKLGKALYKFFAKYRPDAFFIRSKVLKLFKEVKPCAFLTQWYVPLILDVVRKCGITSVLWCMDDPMIIEERWFYGDWFRYASNFDFVYTISKSALPFYKEAGATSVNWLPLYFDPYLTGEEIGIECVISFVGNYFSDRLPACERILFPLIQKFEKDVHIFGSGWNETVVKRASLHRAIPRSALKSVFLGSKINLNIHRESAYKYPALNFRTFEITGFGGFEMVEYVKGLEELFEIGKELVAPKSSQEAIELAQHYLENDEQRLKIASNGQKRVLNEHTISHRIDSILKQIK